MADRVREDEKNERTIRGLLKLPDNRRCINCNSLGPQYVCTSFWTFVCINCSGIQVKSVSMAKFTSQEVISLQEGGNKNAHEIYLKEWDPQRQSAPDGSNVARLRDFIKHVYVDRRYTGERNSGKPPITKLIDKEDAYQGGSRSPPYEDSYDYDERSPGYDQEGRQYNDYGRSPRLEVVNDWRREDRFGNGRKADDRGASDGDSRLGSRSPDQPRDPEASSPPVVRSVRDILGDNAVPLRIGGPPKVNIVMAADGSSQAQTQLQRIASSNSLGSSSGNIMEVKVEKTASLIDFDNDPEPTLTTTVPQAQQTTVSKSIMQTASTSNDDKWASFDAVPGIRPSQVVSNLNPVESALSQLSVPAYASVMPGQASPLPINGNQFLKFYEDGQWPDMQHQQPSLVPASNIQSTAQQFSSPFNGALGSQSWNSSVGPNVQAATSTPFFGASQVVSTPVPGVSFAGVSQPPAAEVKSRGRRELPADLFAATYFSYHAPVPGWHAGPPYMPYMNASVSIPTPVQPSKSINPFDLGEPSSSQVLTLPSMASLHGVLPNMSPSSGIQHASILGAPSSAWVPSQSLPFSLALAPQQPTYVSAVPPRAYMEPQVLYNTPISGHQVGGFGAATMDQQAASRFSSPAMPSPYSSVGGNPFG